VDKATDEDIREELILLIRAGIDSLLTYAKVVLPEPKLE